MYLYDDRKFIKIRMCVCVLSYLLAIKMYWWVLVSAWKFLHKGGCCLRQYWGKLAAICSQDNRKYVLGANESKCDIKEL